MGVRNAGDAIREARLKAGLSQEQLSEGICSALSLSRIENNSAGVSPSTFQALMERAGASCEMLPAFASRTDFNCFYWLKMSKAYLDSWQLQFTYDELEKVEACNWADNKYYYQEWLLLHCKLQFKTNCTNHQQLLANLQEAISISRPSYQVTKLEKMLLSITEVELFICLAQEYLYLNLLDECQSICIHLFSHIANAKLTLLERNRLNAELSIVYVKYLLATKQYEKALEIADQNRHQMVLDSVNSLLYELTFLTALGFYYTEQTAKAFSLFKTAFYASHAIGSCYATTIKDYVINILQWSIPNTITSLEHIPYTPFPIKNFSNITRLGNGTYDFFSKDVLYIGSLIRELRLEQNVSQTTLCQGLCSNSKLSKIESLTLQPDIALTEALLQRLGISERIFTFWGNAKENKLNELKFLLVHGKRTQNQNRKTQLDQFAELLDKNDQLYWQYYYFEKAKDELDLTKKVQLYKDALHITLPKFDINHILNYRLSYNELSILNNIARAYVDSSTPYKSLKFFNQIIEYMNHCPCDITMQSSTFSITLFNFIRALNRQGLHQEVVNSKSYANLPFMKYTVHVLGLYHFFHCQSLGECEKKESVPLYANYSCCIEELIEFHCNANALRKYIYDDFGITVE